MKPNPTSAVAPLRIGAFRRIWVALVFFNVGHLVQLVASSWLILEMTGSPLWAALMVGAPTLPLLLLAIPAGAAADLLDRRRLLIGALAVMVVAETAMVTGRSLDLLTPILLLGLEVLVGVGVALFNPVWQAMVPALVPQSLVPGAVALNSTTGGIATAIGPAMGGLLVAGLGAGWAFAAGAAGYAVMLIVVVATPAEQFSTESDSMSVAIATGIRYLVFSHGYLSLLLLGCGFGFFASALRAMLPNLTSDVLRGGSSLYGFLLGGFGAGAIVGGLTIDRLGRRLDKRLLPGSIVAFGLAGLSVGAIGNLVAVAIGVVVAGLLWSWILSTLNATFQMLTPDWVRGRAMGAFVLSVFGFLPLGSAAAGWLGDQVGAGPSLIVFSLLVVLIGVASVRVRFPVLGHIEPPVVPADQGRREQAARRDAGPVMVTTQWIVPEARRAEFLAVLDELRRVRLTTGAYQWHAYEAETQPGEFREVYMVHSPEHRMRQPRRLDTRALAVIERAQQLACHSEQVAHRRLSIPSTDQEA